MLTITTIRHVKIDDSPIVERHVPQGTLWDWAPDTVQGFEPHWLAVLHEVVELGDGAECAVPGCTNSIGLTIVDDDDNPRLLPEWFTVVLAQVEGQAVVAVCPDCGILTLPDEVEK